MKKKSHIKLKANNQSVMRKLHFVEHMKKPKITRMGKASEIKREKH